MTTSVKDRGAPRAALGRSAASRVLVALVRGYQLALSPWVGARCRHLPSCSAYAIEALQRFGALSGGRLALERLARCHPWGTYGYDPVPEGPCREDAAKTRGGMP